MTANDVVTGRVLDELAQRGMGRNEFARLMGHTPAWATNKLNGRRRWQVDELDELATRLGLDLHDLFAGYRAVCGRLGHHTFVRLLGRLGGVSRRPDRSLWVGPAYDGLSL